MELEDKPKMNMQAVAAQTRIQQLEAQRQQEETESNKKIVEAIPELVKKVNPSNAAIIGVLALFGGIYWWNNRKS